jgi:small subunit ribosomal protein S6
VREYETMLLCDAGRDDASIQQTLDGFTSLVTEQGGEVAAVDRWGRRRLAYELENLTEGYYAVFTYTLEPDKRSDLEAALPFLEGLVRSKTVRSQTRTRSVER